MSRSTVVMAGRCAAFAGHDDGVEGANLSVVSCYTPEASASDFPIACSTMRISDAALKGFSNTHGSARSVDGSA
jgi:hypothetical protein